MQTWGLERKWRRLHTGRKEPTGTQGTEGAIDGGKAWGSELRTNEKMHTQVQRETVQDPGRSLNLFFRQNIVPEAGLHNSALFLPWGIHIPIFITNWVLRKLTSKSLSFYSHVSSPQVGAVPHEDGGSVSNLQTWTYPGRSSVLTHLLSWWSHWGPEEENT